MTDCKICGKPIPESRLNGYTIPPVTCSKECGDENNRQHREAASKKWRKTSKGKASLHRSYLKKKAKAQDA